MLSPVLESNSPTGSRHTEPGLANEFDGLPLPRRYAAVAAILGAGVLVVLDGAIANVALPSIAQQLQAAPADAVWIVTAYQLAVVMFLLPASAVGERLGYRRVFVGGVALFTAASVLCALAPSLPWLVAARCLQGLGGAAVMPLGLALLRFTYPRRLLGQAIAWNALAVAGATAAGPAVGAGLLSARWYWPPVPGCRARKAPGFASTLGASRSTRSCSPPSCWAAIGCRRHRGPAVCCSPCRPAPWFCWYGARNRRRHR
jgi:DHA2 family multidrug resistance protein-like MFS transporter